MASHTSGTTTGTATTDALGSMEADTTPKSFTFGVSSGENGARTPTVVFISYNRGKEKKKEFYSSIDAILQLPIPANLTTGYGMAYDTGTGLGVLGAAAKNIASDAASNGGDMNSIIDAFSSADISGTLRDAAIATGASVSSDIATVIGASLATSMGGAAAAAAVGNALGGAATGALAGAGKAVNPHLAVLFTGPRFRVHQFNYNFAPKSEQEANDLLGILEEFKYGMAPKIDGAAFFDYPNEFKIIFAPGQNLFEIGASVLTDLSVNYTPTGNHFHKDAMPVSLSLNMSFTELDLITKDKIREGR